MSDAFQVGMFRPLKDPNVRVGGFTRAAEIYS